MALFLEARASLEPGLSVTESLSWLHFSSSTSQIRLIMARFGKVTLKMLRIVFRVNCMVIGLVKRCLRMVGTILRIIQMFAKNIKIDVRMIKLSSGLVGWS